MVGDWSVELTSSRLLAGHRHEVSISQPLLHLCRELEVVVELALVVGMLASVSIELLHVLVIPRSTDAARIVGGWSLSLPSLGDSVGMSNRVAVARDAGSNRVLRVSYSREASDRSCRRSRSDRR